MHPWYPIFAGDCPRIHAPQYGKIRVSGYGPDSVAYYTCDHGYDMHGLNSRKCLHDGSWYGKAPICRPRRSKSSLSPLFLQYFYLAINILCRGLP